MSDPMNIRITTRPPHSDIIDAGGKVKEHDCNGDCRYHFGTPTILNDKTGEQMPGLVQSVKIEAEHDEWTKASIVVAGIKLEDVRAVVADYSVVCAHCGHETALIRDFEPQANTGDVVALRGNNKTFPLAVTRKPE